MCILSESGLYTLVLRCRDAVKQGTVPYRFRKWVTNEVLPQIRKTGKYELEKVPAPVPVFRYLVELRYRDNQTGQEETFKGGCNTTESIVNGTAHKFGFIIQEMISAPVNIAW